MIVAGSLSVRRCGVTVAKMGVTRTHAHHEAPPGALVAFEVLDDGRWPRGWALVGRPVSPALQEQGWVEVTRVAVERGPDDKGWPNACSALYGACARWARKEGTPILTYTLEAEGGASLRGAGWVEFGETEARAWSRPKRPRKRSPKTEGRKRRWIPGWLHDQLWRAVVMRFAADLGGMVGVPA